MGKILVGWQTMQPSQPLKWTFLRPRLPRQLFVAKQCISELRGMNSRRWLSDVDIAASHSGASAQFRARIVASCVSTYRYLNSAFQCMFCLRFLFRYLVRSANHVCAAQPFRKDTLCHVPSYDSQLSAGEVRNPGTLDSTESHFFMTFLQCERLVQAIFM